MSFLEILVVVLGLMWGSFLSVVIWRLDDWRSISTGRSKCVHCDKPLPWYDLIPLVSYGLLRGRCRQCRQRISALYPVLEIVSAALFVLLYSRFGVSWEAGLLLLVFSTMIVTFGYDAVHLLIVDQVVWVGLVLAAGWQLQRIAATGDWRGAGLLVVWGLLLGAGIPLVLVLLGRGQWMGEGDVMLGLLAGVLLGYPNVLVAYFAAFLVGSIYGIGLIILARKKVRDAVPFAPFLVVGSMLAFFYGTEIVNWYTGIGA